VIARRLVSVAALGLVLAGAAWAEDGGEHLYLNYRKMLPGWTVAPTQRGAEIELTEITPPGQSPQSWTDEVAVNILYGAPTQSPQQLLSDRIALVQRECEDSAVGPISPLVENGYETAMRAVACTKVKKLGEGEVTLYKAWKGRDAMYLVARSWRGPPFEKGHVPVAPEVTLQWLAVIQSIVLCDTRDAKRPCPNPAAQAAPAPAK
jgi:hypothetical protein